LFIQHFLLVCSSGINNFMASSKHRGVGFRDLSPFSRLSAFSVPRVTHNCSSCAWVQKQHISYCTLMISYWSQFTAIASADHCLYVSLICNVRPWTSTTIFRHTCHSDSQWSVSITTSICCWHIKEGQDAELQPMPDTGWHQGKTIC
jgi:hypothetical protein